MHYTAFCYARIYLDRVVNISWVLNVAQFQIWQVSEYAKVTQGSKYATKSEQDVNMLEYVWNCDNRQGSEYVLYYAQCDVTLPINEYLLRNRPIQNLVKDLRWATLEK